MAGILALVLILGSALLARAGEHTTPGAIARVDVPDGFTAQYDPNSDVSLLSRGAGAQIMLIAGPDLPPRDTMRQLLQLFGVQHLAPRVRDATLAGFEGVRLDVETQVHERWTVLDLGRSSLVVRAASTASFEALHDATVGTLSNFRVKAFSNGLELWNAQGGKLVWVRK